MNWTRYISLLFVTFYTSLAHSNPNIVNSAGSLQAIAVTAENWGSTTGVLQTFSRATVNDSWTKTDFQIPVSLGSAGMGWGIGLHTAQSPLKNEGDGKTPAGIFSLGSAFGYQELVDTQLNYTQMTSDHWCVDDVSMPKYNQIVKKSESPVGNSTERMLRSDNFYKFGIFVNHNPGALKIKGSCIFVHVWRGLGKTTAGCTAMAEDNIVSLLNWLDASKNPVFITLPVDIYQAKRDPWGLPKIW